jgi:glycosyltransferase involved in cell wall biosynthesis
MFRLGPSCRAIPDEDAMVDVSILLLTKNARQDLERVLPVLFAQKQVSPFEVIAIDSGSSDGTLEVLRRFPVQLRQLPAQEFHHARTRNLAASLASGQILIFLSQDAVPASDLWLKMMISNFEDPNVAAVYGRQFPKSGSSVERVDALDTIYGDEKIVKDPADRNGMGYRFYHFSDVNAAIRRNVWEEEHFPEDLKVFEDLGIAKRILDRGWKIVYEPQAAVFHSHTHTTVGLFKRYFDIGYTLRRLRIWEAPGTRNSMLRDIWRLLKNKFRRVGRRQTRRSARRGLQQDIAKCFGLFLGLNETFLPLTLKRRFSAYGVFG